MSIPFDSVFSDDIQYLQQILTDVDFNANAFQRRISQCDLKDCKGSCCYDGIYLSEESAATILKLSVEKASFFKSIGLKLPKSVIVQGNYHDQFSGPKTATRPHPFSSIASNHPRHFNDTACVFMLDDGRCSLQVLGESENKHRWHYKPVDCWLHPIYIDDQDDLCTVTLPDEDTDPYRTSDYPGYTCFTQCGRTDQSGDKAIDVLKEEIACLSKLRGRSIQL